MPNAVLAIAGIDRQRPEHQGGNAAGHDVPQPDRADELPVETRDQREAARGQAPDAQRLACLAEARRA